MVPDGYSGAMVLAFPGGAGTASTVQFARDRGLEVRVVT